MGWNPSTRAGIQGKRSRCGEAECLTETRLAPADCVDRVFALRMTTDFAHSSSGPALPSAGDTPLRHLQ